MKPEHDRSKLPKWAQHELDRLERDLASAYERLTAGPEDSDTIANPYGAAPSPLGRGPVVEFRWSEDWEDKIQARLDGDTLRVMGGTGLLVHPVAGNVIEINVRGR